MVACRKPRTKSCLACQQDFRPWHSLQKFCSRRCMVAVRPAPRRKTRACQQCQKEFASFASSLQKFCSTTCGREARAAMAWREVHCLNCGGVFVRRTQPSFRAKRFFCSRLCSQNYTAGENHPHWRGGGGLFDGGVGWLRLADQIRERDGRRCRRCGKTEAENGRRLPVDHLIPRRLWPSIEEANNPDNLATLCDECHGWKTATIERKYLLGDVLDLVAFRRSLDLGSAAKVQPVSDPGVQLAISNFPTDEPPVRAMAGARL